MIRRWFGLVAGLLAPLPLHAQRPPHTPFVARGSCPGECCKLGRWTAGESLRVYPTQRGSRAPTFTINRNQSFVADSADFYTLALGILVVRRPMRVSDHMDAEFNPAPVTHGDSVRAASLAKTLAVGDTLYVIGEMPEAGEVLWVGGATAIVEYFWAEDARGNPTAPAVQVRPIQHEWWVHIRTTDGRTGWIEAWDRRIHGSDACG